MADIDPPTPPRPLPPRGAAEFVHDWLGWMGITRLLLAAVSVSVVVGGGWWLTRPPALPPEADLPITSAVASPATLAPPPPAPSTIADGPLVVHVAGAVRAAGVYELAAGARVADAIDLAGGPTDGAELDGVNLALPVVDGQRVYVPVIDEVDPAEVPDLPLPSAGGSTEVGEATAAPVNINSAAAAVLETLPGIGPATAAAIVDDRNRNGPFAKPSDLLRVTGIGPAKLESLDGLIVT